MSMNTNGKTTREKWFETALALVVGVVIYVIGTYVEQ